MMDAHGPVPHAPLPSGNYLARKLGAFGPLDADAVGYLGRLHRRAVRVPARTDLIVEGEVPVNAYILREGWAIRYKVLADGRRQVLGCAIPGDIIGLGALWFPASDTSVAALTEVMAAPVELREMLTLLTRLPRLGAAIAWSLAREESMLTERAVRLGRRTARERVAHAIMELWQRLQVVGLTQAHAFRMPITQETLADYLGLSVVHVDRTLQSLRRDGLIESARGEMRILDMDSLAAIAGFPALYLRDRAASAKARRLFDGPDDSAPGGRPSWPQAARPPAAPRDHDAAA